MQFPPIKKGNSNGMPNANINNPGGSVVVQNNDNYVKNIKKNPQN